MEYMDRGTLEDRLKASGRLPWKEVLQVLKDAGAGLAYAESKGIVHRDLKPANLMQNAAGAVKIADLGLATNIEAESEVTSGEKKVLGTAHFMSPEQARGEKLDTRSDLYSLGATAYRLLSGSTPYEGATSKDILRALLREDPRRLENLVQGVPPAMLGIIERMMRRELASRTPSAAELLRELSDLERSLSAPAAAQPRPKSSARPPLALFAAAIVFGAGGWYVWQWKEAKLREREPQPIAEDSETKPSIGSEELPLSQRQPPDAPDVNPAQANPAQANPAASNPASPSDERELELLESRARIALLEILQRQDKPEDRITALVEMARKFNGTSAATEAGTKANELEAQLRIEQAALSERHTSVMALIARLREAAKLDADPPRPGVGLLAMRNVAGQEAYSQDALYLSERARLEQELLGRATEYAKQVLTRTQADLEAGRQEVAQTSLIELLPLFDLPEYPLGQAPAGIDALQEQGRRARERLSNLRSIASQILENRQREDARLLAGALYGPEGLEKELAQLDFAGAATRVSKLGEATSTLPVRQALIALSAELNEAAQAFPLLAREFSAGWKRKGVDDPRDRSEALRNCVGADGEGLLLEGAQGGTERVPWSAFATHTRELGRLFNERFTRDLKPEEARCVRALLQYAAVGEVLSLGTKMLDPTKKANFTEGNAKEVLECYAPAQGWVAKAGSSPTLVREIEAAQLLSRVWMDTTSNSIASAVAGTERLLSDYRDTLLVRLLSDGTEMK
jgi:serine/threonine protein kinase